MKTTRSTAAAILLSIGCVPTGCGGDDSGSTASESEDVYRVADALGELPASALKGESALILTGDLSAATELGDLARPSDPGDEAALQWLNDLSGGPASSEKTSVFVPLPVGLTSATTQGSTADDLYGWSPLDVDSFASVSSPPDDFTVISGAFDEDTLDADLKEVQDGILTDRDVEDNEIDLSAPSPLSRAGAPTRLAQQDGRIAFSSSTPAVSSWLEGAESAADDQALGSVAQALDRDDVYSAVLTRSAQGTASRGGVQPLPAGAERIRAKTEDMLPEEPFDVVGLGWGQHDGAAAVYSAYHFESDTAAEGAVDALRDLYTSGTGIASRQPFSDHFTVEDVSAEDDVVVVSTRPKADSSVDTLYKALQTRDVLFTSR